MLFFFTAFCTLLSVLLLAATAVSCRRCHRFSRRRCRLPLAPLCCACTMPMQILLLLLPLNVRVGLTSFGCLTLLPLAIGLHCCCSPSFALPLVRLTQARPFAYKNAVAFTSSISSSSALRAAAAAPPPQTTATTAASHCSASEGSLLRGCANSVLHRPAHSVNEKAGPSERRQIREAAVRVLQHF